MNIASKNCIFCKIIKGEIPSYKIYEDDKTYAFLDIKKDAIGHTLVIPKQHSANLLSCNEEYLTAVFNTAQKIARHYVANCGFTGVNVMTASGVSAQQTVFHFHVHVIPRKDDDGMDLWPLGDGDESMDLGEVCQRLAL